MTEKKSSTPKRSRSTTAKPRVRKPAKARSVPKPAVIAAIPPRSATVAKPVQRTYTMAVGRRKSAIARVRYSPKGSGQFSINGVEVGVYFPTFELQKTVNDPITLTKIPLPGDLSIKVHGGGKHGQAEAVRLGISRLLVEMQADLRTALKRAGFLTRDPRVKERKKYGLKRARRAPQWQKR